MSVIAQTTLYQWFECYTLQNTNFVNMKTKGNGQAKILYQDELTLLFNEGLDNIRDRLIFAVCYFTACRVSECLSLEWTDIKGNSITFRKENTKGKLKTRVIDIHSQLAKIFIEYTKSGFYQRSIRKGYLFPSPHPDSITLSRARADKILKIACERVKLEGVSTHSFRRTCLTTMNNAGIPLRHIQEISGHADLGTLQRYLEVTPEDVIKAVSTLGWDMSK